MASDHDSEPPVDPSEVGEEVQENQEETMQVEVFEATTRIVHALGNLGVPKAVVYEAKRREQTADAISVVLQLGAQAALDESESLPTPEHTAESYARRMRNPSLTIQEGDGYYDGMTQTPTDNLSRLRPKKNFWSAVKELEPYEHTAVRKIQMAVTADPYTRASDMTAIISFRPSAFTSVFGLERLAKLKDIIESYHPEAPGMSTNSGKVYNLDTDDAGIGVLWRQAYDDDRKGTLTTELRGVDLVIRHSFKDEKIERDDKQNPVQTDEGKEQLTDRLESHTDILVDNLPEYFEHLTQLWIDEPLPKMEFELLANKRLGEGDLEELKERDKKQELHEVPSEVVDGRQRELYLATIRPRPEVSFEMVGGLTDEKERVRRLVKRAKNPELYAAAGINPKPTGLLVGPPGCGKTMLAEAAAHEMDSIFLAAKVSDIESMWAGEAEKNVQALFGLIQVLGETRKVTLFIDEFEGLASSRNSQHMMNWERKITTEFLSALNHQYPNCLILAATNDGGHVDPAITRSGRFSDIIEINPPDELGRVDIINGWMGYFKGKASTEIFKDIDAQEMATIAEGLSGADIKTVIENTIGDAVDDAIDKDAEFIPVTMDKLKEAIEKLQEKNLIRHQSYIG